MSREVPYALITAAHSSHLIQLAAQTGPRCMCACVCYWRRSLPVVHTRTRLFFLSSSLSFSFLFPVLWSIRLWSSIPLCLDLGCYLALRPSISFTVLPANSALTCRPQAYLGILFPRIRGPRHIQRSPKPMSSG